MKRIVVFTITALILASFVSFAGAQPNARGPSPGPLPFIAGPFSIMADNITQMSSDIDVLFSTTSELQESLEELNQSQGELEGLLESLNQSHEEDIRDVRRLLEEVNASAQQNFDLVFNLVAGLQQNITSVEEGQGRVASRIDSLNQTHRQNMSSVMASFADFEEGQELQDEKIENLSLTCKEKLSSFNNTLKDMKSRIDELESRLDKLNESTCIPTSTSESVCNGVDDDCDEEIDEDFASETTTCGTGACAATGQTQCTDGELVDTCSPGMPAPSDATCDGVDEDCDGQVDEDYAPETTTCGVGACASTGQTQCQSGEITDTCSPETPSTEVCDGIDNDCDGQTDEDFASETTTCGTGACASTGQTQCQEGEVVDTCSPGSPASSDATCDGIDDDCDGQVDEDYAPEPTSCGTGACSSTGQTQCQSGEITDTCSPGTPSTEVCDGIDNDCDGQIDEGC